MPFGFASYYGNHMVLQKSPERAILWGYGKPEGAQVTVYLSGPMEYNSSPVTVENGKCRRAGGFIQTCTGLLLKKKGEVKPDHVRCIKMQILSNVFIFGAELQFFLENIFWEA